MSQSAFFSVLCRQYLTDPKPPFKYLSGVVLCKFTLRPRVGAKLPETKRAQDPAAPKTCKQANITTDTQINEHWVRELDATRCKQPSRHIVRR